MSIIGDLLSSLVDAGTLKPAALEPQQRAYVHALEQAEIEAAQADEYKKALKAAIAERDSARKDLVDAHALLQKVGRISIGILDVTQALYAREQKGIKPNGILLENTVFVDDGRSLNIFDAENNHTFVQIGHNPPCPVQKVPS